MSFSFKFNGEILVLAYSHFRGANIAHPGGLGSVWSCKMQKLLDFEIYMGQMHCDGSMYCTCGSEEVMCLLILCEVFFYSVVIIFFLFII